MAEATASSEGAQPWFVEAFRADYLEVYAHRDLASARREVEGLLAGGLSGRVLDLGCGFGRHSLALRELGLQSFGIDLSIELLLRVREQPGAERMAGRVARADFRALPFANASFAGVLSLFSSFGYFGEADNRLVLREVARVLRPGGAAVFDLINAARLRSTLVPRSESQRGGATIEERRRLTEAGARVEKQVRVLRPGQPVRAWRESVRLFEPAEFAVELREVGLRVTRLWGGFDARPYSPEAERMIVWAERD